MVDEVFVDGVGRISIRGGVVRIDLLSYSESEQDSDGKDVPKSSVKQRLIMPIDSYGRMFATMGRTMEQLSKLRTTARAGESAEETVTVQ